MFNYYDGSNCRTLAISQKTPTHVWKKYTNKSCETKSCPCYTSQSLDTHNTRPCTNTQLIHPIPSAGTMHTSVLTLCIGGAPSLSTLWYASYHAVQSGTTNYILALKTEYATFSSKEIFDYLGKTNEAIRSNFIASIAWLIKSATTWSAN